MAEPANAASIHHPTEVYVDADEIILKTEVGEDDDDDSLQEQAVVAPTVEAKQSGSAYASIAMGNDGEQADLSYEQVFEVFRRSSDFLVDEIPQKPSTGTIYCIDCTEHDNWQRDGFRWKPAENVEHPKGPKGFKVQSFIKSGVGPRIQKNVYSVPDFENLLCVQYCLRDTAETKVKKRKGLTVPEALALLSSCDESISSARAIRPKGGEIYLFNTEVMGDDWRCDDYVWRNCGTAFLPSKNPKIKKTFFSIRTPKSGEQGCTDFQKVAFVALDKPHVVMVQYIGDENVFVPMSHGNRKRGSVEHKRTCPSVLEKLKKGVQDYGTIKAFQLFPRSSDGPRNMQQITNIKHRLKKQSASGGGDRKRRKLAFVTEEAPDEVQLDYAQEISVDEHGNPILPAGYEIVQISSLEEDNILSGDVPMHQTPVKEELPHVDELYQQELQDPDDDEDSQGGGEAFHSVQYTEPASLEQESIPMEENESEGAAARTEHQEEASGTCGSEHHDPEAEISQLQKEILEQQKMNLRLREQKFKLEIETLQNTTPHSTVQTVQPIKQTELQQMTYVIQNPDELTSSSFVGANDGVTYVQDVQAPVGNQNVVYVQDIDGSEQVVWIQEPSAQ